MGKTLYTEEIYKEKVKLLYNNELEVVSRFKGASQPILIKDKYGIINLPKANLLFLNKPSINLALNKTEYFMNLLREAYPEIAEKIKPASEYTRAKDKMLFDTKYGVVSISPDALLAGHCPNIRSAIDRKAYFKNQLLFIYDNKYDFEITGTDRHSGRVTLICKLHGKQSIDSDTIFMGCGCPECNHGWEKSNTFYLIRLYNSEESFYKLGISYRKNETIRRYSDYKILGYEIEEIKTISFEDFLKARELESKLKKLISNSLYKPKNWPYETSTECFTDELLPLIINNINYDIVSTSSESLSSCENNGSEITTPNEDN